ncbi:uncharacterized protein PAE49_014478 [Odontesthes bonariensis]|uniref:uncharacterized protein LOC142397167 n=1 Tax=Odontesthes bonariensis TaxID=219752 RepID=UPI003F58528F
MSWAEEDWTVGLSGRVLQKVKELQIHEERLSRENKQKQLQLDNIHTSLEKQTLKYEEVRGELQYVQRELQSVQEEAKVAVTSRERVNQELHTRQAQICSLEGQLDAARTLNNKLTQEVKRLEAELEKLQNSSRSADSTLFSTPCWSSTSPWEHNGSRQEEKSGQRDEGQSNHIRRLQFSDMSTASLSRQQHKGTPQRHPSDQSDAFSTPLSVFPWERDDSRPTSRRRQPPSPQTPGPDVINQGLLKQGVGGKEEHKTEAEVPSSEIRSRISALENELSEKVGTLKSIQNEMVQTKKELAAKEVGLQKARDELSLAHTRMTQDSERASGVEQRLKQLQEELKCQRQNAESSRLQHQQRAKELEKQHQRDLSELQKERQCLERQQQQEVNKLNQELQQARTLHNALQAQADKLSLQKQALNTDLDSLKEKLKWTEEQLKESQKTEAQTQAKLTEAVREAEGVAVSLEQSRKRERALEEEGRRLVEEQADTQRLLKELQEEKSASAPPPQPVQFCAVAQTFSPHSSYTHSPRPPTHSKRPAAAQAEQEGVDGRNPAISASYPSDREPGEGIDAEHITITTNSESLQIFGQTNKSNEETHKSRNEAIEIDISGTPISTSVDGDGTTSQSLILSAEKTPLKSEQTISSEELKRENAQLRSEIRDVQEELQRRLEDLETQRRAETEARTRLKQLSRKYTSQSVEREEKDREVGAQLENEKVETERLRKTIAALEAEMKRGREEEKNKAQDDRESEMIELNIQLKNELAEVKAQLALEQEGRKREEEERNRIISKDSEVRKELSMKLAELKAEVKDLKHRNDDSPEQEKLSFANSPLTYLTLHDNELNSSIVCCDNKLLPSPEQHLLFCQSTNKLNMLMSKAAADIIPEEREVIGVEQSPQLDDAQTACVPSQIQDTKQDYQGRPSSSDLQRGELSTSDLAKEVEHLQREYSKETERANQYQAKLEALQSQVTRQTQQLTMAFEKQSQHISGLLVELQERESALHSQGEELLRCKQELEVLKTEKHEEVKITIKEGEELGPRGGKLAETSKPEQEKESVITFHTGGNSLADYDLNPKEDTSLSQIETPAHFGSKNSNDAVIPGEQHPSPVDSNKSRGDCDPAHEVTENPCGQNGGTADIVTAVRQENWLLKERITDVVVSHTRNPTLKTDSENQENQVKQSQNPANDTLSGSEQEMQSVPNDVMTQGHESLQKNTERSEDLEREDGRTRGEKDLEEVSDVQVDYLQQQVEALQRKVRSLSEETQQQAQELAVWRLASQPAPAFDQSLTNTGDECETLEQVSAVTESLSHQQQTDELTHTQTGAQSQIQTPSPHTEVQPPLRAAQKTQDNITVIREDELSLCCSSNKLQGRMLFSRLQSSNLPEPKSLQSSEKTTEHIQNAPEIDQDSEKEKQKINLQQSDACPPQCKAKRDPELIQMSSQTIAQRRDAKDPLKPSGPNPAKVGERYTEKPEANPNPSVSDSEMNTRSSTEKDVKTEVNSVSSQTEDSLYPRKPPTVCATTQTEEEKVSPVPISEKMGSGDKILFSGSFPIPADPARLAERIRRNRTQLSAAFDDTEYEPYGLPEVVMKGFADIPSGPSCPYIVRRGLLGTAVVPVSQKDPREEEEETD